jgi:hypothetical protein
MRRDQYIDELYRVVREQVIITRAAYAESLEGWDIEPVLVDGEQVGLMVTKGPEIHFRLDRKKMLVHTRRVIRNYVAPHLARHGFLTTIALSGSKDIDFLERFGFVEIDTKGRAVMFRLDQLKIK